MRSKRCWKCGEVKTSAEFSHDRTKRDGLHSDCKECSRAYSRAYLEARREEINARRRAYYETHREEASAKDRDYHEAHREEILARNRKRQAEIRRAAREVATRNGEPWTPAEDHVVLTSEGTVLDIAIELGRTTSSVKYRRNHLRRKAVTA